MKSSKLVGSVALGMAITTSLLLLPQTASAGSATASTANAGQMAGYQALFPPVSGQFSVETKVARITSCPAKGVFKVPLEVLVGGKISVNHLDVTVLNYECHYGVGSSSGMAGDLLRIVLEFNPPFWPGHIVAKVENLTTGSIVFRRSRSQLVHARSVFVGLNNQYGSIPPFPVVGFFNANLNGTPLGDLPGLEQDIMVNKAGSTMADTSGLTSNGEGFQVTYVQST